MTRNIVTHSHHELNYSSCCSHWP